MKQFLIATNYIKDENLKLTSEIEEYISARGGSSKRIVGDMDGEVAYRMEEAEQFDGIIALGGDGTILKVTASTASPRYRIHSGRFTSTSASFSKYCTMPP